MVNKGTREWCHYLAGDVIHTTSAQFEDLCTLDLGQLHDS